MPDKYADVIIGDKKYRIGVFPASVGAMTFIQFQSQKYLSDPNMYAAFTANIYSVLSQYVEHPDGTESAIPMYSKADRQWLVQEPDMMTQLDLFAHVLAHNFGDPTGGQSPKPGDSPMVI